MSVAVKTENANGTLVQWYTTVVFLTFSKSATPQRILAEGENSATVQRKFVLSWNHYQILSHVENPRSATH